MSSYPVKKMKKETDISKKQNTEVAETSPYSATSFISYRYSYKSVSSFNGKTHIKAKQERFENGKFETEEFEGTADGNLYDNAVEDLQRSLIQNFSSLFNPFSFLPSFSQKDDKDKERV